MKKTLLVIVAALAIIILAQPSRAQPARCSCGATNCVPTACIRACYSCCLACTNADCCQSWCDTRGLGACRSATPIAVPN